MSRRGGGSRSKRCPYPTLRELEKQAVYDQNPLFDPTLVRERSHKRLTTVRGPLTDSTGEIVAEHSIHAIEYVDPDEFVKVYVSGVKAMFGLSRTATRVFYAILDAYRDTPVSLGHDCVMLKWFDGGLNGRQIGMCETTFHRGLRELICKRFLAVRAGNLYWINPHLFFKGNRFTLIKEWRKREEIRHKRRELEPLSSDSESSADSGKISDETMELDL